MPQLLASVCVLVQALLQQLGVEPEQQLLPHSATPPGHKHCPPWQLVPLLHTVPHDPQLLLSVCSLTQVPPQLVCPDGHTHVVPEHTPPLGQVTQVPPQVVCPEGHTQLVPEQLPPVGQVTQVPLQLVWPDGQTQLVPEHTPPLGQVAQVLLQQRCPETQQVALL